MLIRIRATWTRARQASGRLDALMRSGLRHCEKLAVIDAHGAGETQAVTVLRIGPDLVFGRLWKESGIRELIESSLQARRYEFDVERAIYLTVLHRLFATGRRRSIGKRGHDKDHPARSLPDGGRDGPGRGGPTDLLRDVAG